jgi:hypothetical protein
MALLLLMLLQALLVPQLSESSCLSCKQLTRTVLLQLLLSLLLLPQRAALLV